MKKWLVGLMMMTFLLGFSSLGFARNYGYCSRGADCAEEYGYHHGEEHGRGHHGGYHKNYRQ